MVNNDSLENKIEAEGIIVGSDYHGNYALIEKAFQTARDDNLIYVLNGDVVNDYRFKELADEMGLKTPYQIQTEYFNTHLDKKDLQTMGITNAIKQYGLEEVISQFQIPENKRAEFEKNLSSIIEYSNSEDFKNNVQSVYEQMIQEKGNEININAFNLQVLYKVFMDEEAKRFAEEMEKYPEVKVLFNKGNHENQYFVETVKKYLNEGKNRIIDLSDYENHYSIKNSSNEELTLLGITNCSQHMPYLHEIFSPEDLQELYQHTMTEKKYSGEVDVLVTHGQIGKPMGLEKAFEVPYLKSAKDISERAKLIIEGHIHNKYDGKNEFGKDMLRAAGEEGVIIKKLEGKITKEWIKLGDNYEGGHNNPALYDVNTYRIKLQNEIEEIMKKQSQTANDEKYENSSDEQSKAA